MIVRLLSFVFVILANWVSGLGAVLRSRQRRPASDPASPPPSSGTGFAIGREISDLSDTSPSPRLGSWLDLPFSAMQTHVYAVGRTGSGKTSLLTVMVDAFIRSDKTFVIIDARGDLINRLLTRIAAHGDAAYWRDRLTIIDLPSEWSVPFNFFASPGDPYGIAGAIYDSIEERAPGGLGVQVSETLRSCLLALAFGRGKWTMLHIEPMLTNRAFRDAVLADCTDPFVLGFWDRFNSLSPEQRGSWTGAVINKVTPMLAVPQLRRMLGQTGCLPFRKLIDTKGQVILIRLGISELHSAAGLLGSMVSSAIIQAAMSRATDTSEGQRNPVCLVCDEFENYCNPLFHEVIQEGRRMEIEIALFHQNLAQIPPATCDLVLNNIGILFFFATGARDAAHLSREIGGDQAFEARTVLTRQSVGQAYLLRRGEEPRRVQVKFSPDPDVDPARISAIREASLTNWARPASEIDREIEKNFAAIRDMADTSAPRGQNPAASPIGKAIEVRPISTGSKPKKEGTK